MHINNTSKFTKMRTDLDQKKDYIIDSLLSGVSPTKLCLELNCKIDTLRSRYKKWIPDYKPDYTKQIRQYGGKNKWESLSEYTQLKGKSCKRDILYRLLVEERGNNCSECGISSIWNGKKLRLQVDHINGSPYENNPNNLRLLCPNCHSQTETFSNRNSLASVVER
jgi:hypothetical protein